MEPKRHLSRWHVPALPASSTRDGAVVSTPEPEVSLRYLNEFVGKLQCASALLDHKLYPDSKEITEVQHDALSLCTLAYACTSHAHDLTACVCTALEHGRV